MAPAPRPRRSRALLAASSALVALVLAACGGGGGEDAAGAPASFTGGEATFVGDDGLAWQAAEVTAELADGALDVTLVCEGVIPHNLVLEGVQDEEELVACEGEDEASASVALEPGTYTFWCSIPGHRGAGMEGVLTVS